MAYEAILQTYSAVAAVDLSAKQYYAVAYDANGNINLAAAGKNMDGVLQDKPTAGHAGMYARDGISKVAITAGVAVTIDQLLQVDAGGTLTPVTTGTPVAKALQAVGAGGPAVVFISASILRSNAAF